MTFARHTANFTTMEPIEIPSSTPLRLAYLPGRSDRLVIALAGVGRERRKPPPFELVGAASNGGENHVLLVSDPLRCWMNHPDYAAELTAQIEALVKALNVQQVVALGNSMGAFMAIKLAELTKIDTVVALTPQFSAHQNLVPEETRWTYFRHSISDWHHMDVGAMSAPGTTYFVFHGDSPDEIRHWARFPTCDSMHHYVLNGMNHKLAIVLKKRKVLNRIINAAMDHRPRAVRKVLERRGGGQFEPYYRPQYQEVFGAPAI